MTSGGCRWMTAGALRWKKRQQAAAECRRKFPCNRRRNQPALFQAELDRPGFIDRGIRKPKHPLGSGRAATGAAPLFNDAANNDVFRGVPEVRR